MNGQPQTDLYLSLKYYGDKLDAQLLLEDPNALIIAKCEAEIIDIKNRMQESADLKTIKMQESADLKTRLELSKRNLLLTIN